MDGYSEPRAFRATHPYLATRAAEYINTVREFLRRP